MSNYLHRHLSAICLLVAVSGCSTTHISASAAGCRGTPSENKAVVLAFYEQAFTQKDPTKAFADFVATGFIEHKPDVPSGTRAEVVNYLNQLIQELPHAKWEVLRSASEEDLVFLHAKFTPADGQPAYAIVDVFRLANCKIVEHWDVVGPPREQQPNPQSRF